jgi:6-phosphogluconolactonase
VIHILEDPESLGRAVAESVVDAAATSIAARGVFRVALSGGRTPQRLYELLASSDDGDRLDWARVEVLFADERAVPPDHPDSNYRMVREKLLVPAGIPASNVRRMRGEAEDLEAAAREYEVLLGEPVDQVILGVGEDGHIASLFPGSTALSEFERRVIAVTGSKPPPRRLTITPRVLAEARQVAVLASGRGKARAVADALEGPAARTPAALVRDRDWYLDRAAASALSSVAGRA